jgi:hypothetical protein
VLEGAGCSLFFDFMRYNMRSDKGNNKYVCKTAKTQIQKIIETTIMVKELMQTYINLIKVGY